jgi:hypothetical protein
LGALAGGRGVVGQDGAVGQSGVSCMPSCWTPTTWQEPGTCGALHDPCLTHCRGDRARFLYHHAKLVSREARLQVISNRRPAIALSWNAPTSYQETGQAHQHHQSHVHTEGAPAASVDHRIDMADRLVSCNNMAFPSQLYVTCSTCPQAPPPLTSACPISAPACLPVASPSPSPAPARR